MNRRVKHPKPHQTIAVGDLQMLDSEYSWTTLTSNERKKCKQKFDLYKPPGSDKLSKYQLQRMLREMGKDMTQQQILEKIWETDPKGQGFVSFDAFIKTIANEKEKKYVEVTNFIGLTFDSVLAQQRLRMRDDTLQEITLEFLKIYLAQNFQLDININSLVGKKSSNKSVNRNQFMNIFS